MNNAVNELVDFVSEPKREKTPSNWALHAVLFCANAIFFVIDAISGFTVYLITAWWLYGLLTGLAGFIPLLLHEAAFVRAYASQQQKNIAIIGALLAILSVILIGICAAVINIVGVTVEATIVEVITVASLVVIAAGHALLFMAYFYLDHGIQQNQRTEQAIANGIQKSRVIGASGRVLRTAKGALAYQKAIEREFGPEGAQAMELILSRLLQDKEGNGIPDILEGKRSQPTHQYNQTAERVPFRENGHGSGDDLPNE